MSGLPTTTVSIQPNEQNRPTYAYRTRADDDLKLQGWPGDQCAVRSKVGQRSRQAPPTHSTIQDDFCPTPQSDSGDFEPAEAGDPRALIGGRLYAVSDGVTLAAQGDEASRLTIEALQREYYSTMLLNVTTSPADALQRSLLAANRLVAFEPNFRACTNPRCELVQKHVKQQEPAVHNFSRDELARRQQDKKHGSSGTCPSCNAPLVGLRATLSTAVIRGHDLWLANIGDSAVFLYDEKTRRVQPVSKANKLQIGQTSMEITQIRVEGPIPLQPSQYLILATDGLINGIKRLQNKDAHSDDVANYLQDELGKLIVADSPDSLPRAVNTLIARITEKSFGYDDITLMIVKPYHIDSAPSLREIGAFIAEKDAPLDRVWELYNVPSRRRDPSCGRWQADCRNLWMSEERSAVREPAKWPEIYSVIEWNTAWQIFTRDTAGDEATADRRIYLGFLHYQVSRRLQPNAEPWIAEDNLAGYRGLLDRTDLIAALLNIYQVRDDLNRSGRDVTSNVDWWSKVRPSLQTLVALEEDKTVQTFWARYFPAGYIRLPSWIDDILAAHIRQDGYDENVAAFILALFKTDATRLSETQNALRDRQQDLPALLGNRRPERSVLCDGVEYAFRGKSRHILEACVHWHWYHTHPSPTLSQDTADLFQSLGIYQSTDVPSEAGWNSIKKELRSLADAAGPVLSHIAADILDPKLAPSSERPDRDKDDSQQFLASQPLVTQPVTPAEPVYDRPGDAVPVASPVPQPSTDPVIRRPATDSDSYPVPQSTQGSSYVARVDDDSSVASRRSGFPRFGGVLRFLIGLFVVALVAMILYFAFKAVSEGMGAGMGSTGASSAQNPSPTPTSRIGAVPLVATRTAVRTAITRPSSTPKPSATWTLTRTLTNTATVTLTRTSTSTRTPVPPSNTPTDLPTTAVTVEPATTETATPETGPPDGQQVQPTDTPEVKIPTEPPTLTPEPISIQPSSPVPPGNWGLEMYRFLLPVMQSPQKVVALNGMPTIFLTQGKGWFSPDRRLINLQVPDPANGNQPVPLTCQVEPALSAKIQTQLLPGWDLTKEHIWIVGFTNIILERYIKTVMDPQALHDVPVPPGWYLADKNPCKLIVVANTVNPSSYLTWPTSIGDFTVVGHPELIQMTFGPLPYPELRSFAFQQNVILAIVLHQIAQNSPDIQYRYAPPAVSFGEFARYFY